MQEWPILFLEWTLYVSVCSSFFGKKKKKEQEEERDTRRHHWNVRVRAPPMRLVPSDMAGKAESHDLCLVRAKHSCML